MADPHFNEEEKVYWVETEVNYDLEKGELTETGLYTSVVYNVRQSVLDAALRQAMIYELERLGYTVISPHED